MLEINNDEVICPACSHQFHAVPVNVQKLHEELPPPAPGGQHVQTKPTCSCGWQEASRAQLWKHQADELRAAYPVLVAENERLREALLEAADDVEGWGAYAGDYFKDKWNLAGDVARIRAAATTAEPRADEGGEDAPSD